MVIIRLVFSPKISNLLVQSASSAIHIVLPNYFLSHVPSLRCLPISCFVTLLSFVITDSRFNNLINNYKNNNSNYISKYHIVKKKLFVYFFY